MKARLGTGQVVQGGGCRLAQGWLAGCEAGHEQGQVPVDGGGLGRKQDEHLRVQDCLQLGRDHILWQQDATCVLA